jgi:3-isopropylmalate/(R)-2-methylmalate dehydratase large subunit
MVKDSVNIHGRVLFLSEDPAKVIRQLGEEEFDLDQALPLRDQITNEEITPSWVCYYFDRRLGDFAYIGVKCGEYYPLHEDAIRYGQFVCSVAGQCKGKGSSREASPFAELASGIRLVIAESFDPRYLHNCHNLGLLASTNFDLVDMVRSGEPIPMSEFTEDLDPITSKIVEMGGLFPFNHARLAGKIHIPIPNHGPRPMTLADKILARNTVVDPMRGRFSVPSVKTGDGLFVKTDWRFSHEYVTPMAASFLRTALGEHAELMDSTSILAFRDHLTFLHKAMPEERLQAGLLDVALKLKASQEDFCNRYGIRLHGELKEDQGSEGICHVMVAERYALPGQVVVGTDSHTPHSGALGCLAFGVGTTDIANAWVTGDVHVTVPPTCRVRLKGVLRPGVSAKDLALHLLRVPFIRQGHAAGHVLEFEGEAITRMNTDERATLTNMAAEMGAFTGIVAPDKETVRFLRERRNVEFTLEPWMQSDPGAVYAATLEVDCSMLSPMVSRPGDPGNGIALEDLGTRPAVHIAYAGSCTGGKVEDLERVHEVLSWAIANGKSLAQHVEFYVQFGSEDVRKYAEAQGWVETFQRIGARILGPGCGACIHAGPGVSSYPSQVTISAINRNFPGRCGPGPVWLASPATVAASAILGRIGSFEELKR